MAPSGGAAFMTTQALPSPDSAAAAAALFRVTNATSNANAPFRSNNNSNSMVSFPPAPGFQGNHRMMPSMGGGGQQQQQLKQRRMSMDSQLLHFKHDPTAATSDSTNTNNYEDERLDDELDDEDLEDDDDEGALDMDNNNEVEVRINRLARLDALKAEDKQQQQQPQSQSTATVPKNASGEPIRKRNVGVPKFLRFLYQILETEDREIIAWSHKGTAFQIRQPEELAERVLPKYFKHNKVSSFQRQLNYFGFKKWTKTQTTICTFSHPFFLRGEKDKMKLIKRKERVAPLGGGGGSAGGSSHTNSPHGDNNGGAYHDEDDNDQGNQDIVTNMPPTSSNSSSLSKRQRANTTVKPKGGIGARELAMRRHSTGALALSATLSPPGAVGAAAAALINRKRSGTMDLELELQAQKGMDLNKEPALRLPSRAKRKSLPHVMLPPSLRDRKGNQIFSNQFIGNVDFNGNGSGLNDARPFASTMGSGAATNSGGMSMGMNGVGGGGGYFGHRMSPESVSTMKQDASAVLPVSPEMMMQHVYLRQHSHPGAIGAGHAAATMPYVQLSAMKSDNAMDMSDLSAPLQHTTATWAVPQQQQQAPVNSYQHQQQQQQQQQLKESNMMMLNPFKYGDPTTSNNGTSVSSSSFDGMPIMDYATNSAQLSSHALKMHNQQQQHLQQQQQHANFLAHQQQQQQQQQEQQQNYYLDVLLESAALDDQLSTAAQSSEPQAPGISTAWDQHPYLQEQQQQQQTQQQHVSPYGLMQQQQQQPHLMSNQHQHHQHALQQHQQMQQLSAMNSDMSNTHAHRF